MTYLVSLWVALAAVIGAMALYRKSVSRNEDDALHLNTGTEQVFQQQTEVAVKLDWIDKWGKALTAVEILFGLALAAAWLYQSWLNSAKMN